MAYVKARNIRGHVYYTLTRSYRKEGKVREAYEIMTAPVKVA
jgi:hypothetical protein